MWNGRPQATIDNLDFISFNGSSVKTRDLPESAAREWRIPTGGETELKTQKEDEAMKKFLVFLAMMIAMMMVALPLQAGTLYDQEGTADDGTPGIDASGHGPANASTTNWIYQYGGGSWSGVYAAGDGWVTDEEAGDPTLEVEADIEMYFSEEVSNNKIYFHIGNLYTATGSDKIAYVDGTFSSNNGQYIGISFDGTTKEAADFETDGTGALTGKIIGGMQSDNDTWRSQDNAMDIEILLSWGAGWRTPSNFGDGAHGTIQKTLWWLVADGAPGTYNYQWRVRILPTAHQPDGDYYLDPVIVHTPVL